MPHYKDGTPAKVGDIVKFTEYDGTEKVGALAYINAKAETCNATIKTVTLQPVMADQPCVSLKDCELVYRAPGVVEVPIPDPPAEGVSIEREPVFSPLTPQKSILR